MADELKDKAIKALESLRISEPAVAESSRSESSELVANLQQAMELHVAQEEQIETLSNDNERLLQDNKQLRRGTEHLPDVDRKLEECCRAFWTMAQAFKSSEIMSDERSLTDDLSQASVSSLSDALRDSSSTTSHTSTEAHT